MLSTTIVLAVLTAMVYSHNYHSPPYPSDELRSHRDHQYDPPPPFPPPQYQYPPYSRDGPPPSSEHRSHSDPPSDHDPPSPFPPSHYPYSKRFLLPRAPSNPEHPPQYGRQKDPPTPFPPSQSPVSNPFLLPHRRELDSTPSAPFNHEHPVQNDRQKEHNPRPPFRPSENPFRNPFLLPQRRVPDTTSYAGGLSDRDSFSSGRRFADGHPDQFYSLFSHKNLRARPPPSAYRDSSLPNDRSPTFDRTLHNEFPPNIDLQYKINSQKTDRILRRLGDRAGDSSDSRLYHLDHLSNKRVSKPDKARKRSSSPDHAAFGSSLNRVPLHKIYQLFDDIKLQSRPGQGNKVSDGFQRDEAGRVDYRRSNKEHGGQFSAKTDVYEKNDPSRYSLGKHSLPGDQVNVFAGHLPMKGTYSDVQNVPGVPRQLRPLVPSTEHRMKVDQPDTYLLKEDRLYETRSQRLSKQHQQGIGREHWETYLSDKVLRQSQSREEDRKLGPRLGSQKWPDKVISKLQSADPDSSDDIDANTRVQYNDEVNGKNRYTNYEEDSYASQNHLGTIGQSEIIDKKHGKDRNDHPGKDIEDMHSHEGSIQNRVKPSNENYLGNQDNSDSKNPAEDIKIPFQHTDDPSGKDSVEQHSGNANDLSDKNNSDDWYDQSDKDLEQEVQSDSKNQSADEVDLTRSGNYFIDQDAESYGNDSFDADQSDNKSNFVDQGAQSDSKSHDGDKDELLDSTNYSIDQDVVSASNSDYDDPDTQSERENHSGNEYDRSDSKSDSLDQDDLPDSKNVTDNQGVQFHKNRSDESVDYSDGGKPIWGNGDAQSDITDSGDEDEPYDNNRSEDQDGQSDKIGSKQYSEKKAQGTSQNKTEDMFYKADIKMSSVEDQLEKDLNHGEKYYSKRLGEIIKKRLDKVIPDAIEELNKQVESVEAISPHTPASKRDQMDDMFEPGNVTQPATQNSSSAPPAHNFDKRESEMEDEEEIMRLFRADLKRFLKGYNKMLADEKAKSSSEGTNCRPPIGLLKNLTAVSTSERDFEDEDEKSEADLGVNGKHTASQQLKQTGSSLSDKHNGSSDPMSGQDVHFDSGSDRKDVEQQKQDVLHSPGSTVSDRHDIGSQKTDTVGKDANNGTSDTVFNGHNDGAFDKPGGTSADHLDTYFDQTSDQTYEEPGGTQGLGNTDYDQTRDKIFDRSEFKTIDRDIALYPSGAKPLEHSGDSVSDQSGKIIDMLGNTPFDEADEAIVFPEDGLYKLFHKTGQGNRFTTVPSHKADRPPVYHSYDSLRKQIYEPHGGFDDYTALGLSGYKLHRPGYEDDGPHEAYGAHDYNSFSLLGYKQDHEKPRSSGGEYGLLGYRAFPTSSYQASDRSRNSASAHNYKGYNAPGNRANDKLDYRAYGAPDQTPYGPRGYRAYDEAGHTAYDPLGYKAYGPGYKVHSPSGYKTYDHPDYKAYAASGYEAYEPHRTVNDLSAFKAPGGYKPYGASSFKVDATRSYKTHRGPDFGVHAKPHYKPYASPDYAAYRSSGYETLRRHGYETYGRSDSDQYAGHSNERYNPRTTSYTGYDPETWDRLSQASRGTYTPQRAINDWDRNDDLDKPFGPVNANQQRTLYQDLRSVHGPEDSTDAQADPGSWDYSVALVLVDRFACPKGSYLSSVHSWVGTDSWGFARSGDIRHFNFSCRNLPDMGADFVMSCQWKGETSRSKVSHFNCGGAAVMSGWQRSRPDVKDGNYVMSYLCCDLSAPAGEPAYKMTQCQRSPYVNEGPGDFTFTVPDGTVLHGVHTDVALSLSDRRYIFEYCQLLRTPPYYG